MKQNLLRLLAVLMALSMLAAACGSDDADDATDVAAADVDDAADDGDGAADDADDAVDFGGQQITITGSERDDPSVAAINVALEVLEERLNLNIEFAGDADWEANINTQVQGGNPPDISLFPQPGKLRDFVNQGYVVPMSDAVVASVAANWAPDLSAPVTFDGVLYAVPTKTDLKSMVFYQPDRFEADGYAVPTTFDEFTALMAEMVAAGEGKPLCVGIESGQATGWPFTDWTEEMVMRLHGGDVYDQWVNHEIPFDDPRIVEAMDAVKNLWTAENVFAAGGSIAATNFGDNAIPLLDGDCYMHRQANFFAGFFPPGTAFADGSEGAIDAFYFPDINGDRPTLTAGNFAAAFNDDPATMAVLEFMATGEYAGLRQAEQSAQLDGSVSGFLSAAQNQPDGVYTPFEQNLIDILLSAELARFDGSDLMPAEVGAGSFWSEGTSLVNGDQDAATAAANIEASWPD